MPQIIISVCASWLVWWPWSRWPIQFFVIIPRNNEILHGLTHDPIAIGVFIANQESDTNARYVLNVVDILGDRGGWDGDCSAHYDAHTGIWYETPPMITSIQVLLPLVEPGLFVAVNDATLDPVVGPAWKDSNVPVDWIIEQYV